MAARKNTEANHSTHNRRAKIVREPLVTDEHGRPIYDASFHVRAAKRQALLGATNSELAADFGISDSLLYSWLNQHPELKAALLYGKRIADGVVAESLYLASIERDVEITEAMTVSDGKGEGSHIEIIKFTRRVGGDPRAAMQWLSNRQKDRWTVHPEIAQSAEDIEASDSALDKLIGKPTT